MLQTAKIVYTATAFLVGIVAFSGVSARELSVAFTDEARKTLTEENQALIGKIAKSAYSDARRLLPELPDDVSLEVSVGETSFSGTGEGGGVSDYGKVVWIIDPSRKEGVTAIVNGFLRGSLLHEMHHMVRRWTAGQRLKESIMDVAIAEGLAVVFARELSGVAAPWDKYPENVDEWVAELKALPKDASKEEWIDTHPDGRRWTIYQAGVYLVEKAMKASGKNPASLVRTPTETILDLAEGA